MPQKDMNGRQLSDQERARLSKEAELLQQEAAKTNSGYKTLYRGCVMSEEDARAFTPGQMYTTETLTATTPDKILASTYSDVENYGGGEGVPVVFEIQKPDGVRGYVRDSMETVLPQGSTFRISRNYMDDDGVVHISLYSKKGNNIEKRIYIFKSDEDSGWKTINGSRVYIDSDGSPHYGADAFIASLGISPDGENTFTVRGFKNAQKLNNHWKVGNGRVHFKEYIDEGITTKEQYVARALELIESKTSDTILGHMDKDGYIIRYDTERNDFVKGRPDRGIATMFKPIKGQTYYDDQRKDDIERGGKA